MGTIDRAPGPAFTRVLSFILPLMVRLTGDNGPCSRTRFHVSLCFHPSLLYRGIITRRPGPAFTQLFTFIQFFLSFRLVQSFGRSGPPSYESSVSILLSLLLDRDNNATPRTRFNVALHFHDMLLDEFGNEFGSAFPRYSGKITRTATTKERKISAKKIVVVLPKF